MHNFTHTHAHTHAQTHTHLSAHACTYDPVDVKRGLHSHAQSYKAGTLNASKNSPPLPSLFLSSSLSAAWAHSVGGQ